MEEKKTYFVPFAFQMYGRIPVEVKPGATLEEMFALAYEKLEIMSVNEMMENASYLADSEEIDEEGIIQDENGMVWEE